MNFTLDKVTDAAYFKISNGKVARTIEHGECVLVDVAKSGKVVGIEILNFSTNGTKLEDSVLKGIPVQISNSTPVAA